MVKQSKNILKILEENDAWLAQIRTCFQEKGVPFVEWHFGKGGNVDLSSIPPEGVFWNRFVKALLSFS